MTKSAPKAPRRLPRKCTQDAARASLELLQALRLAETPKQRCKAVGAIVEAHQGLAYAYARRWRCESIDQEELRQEAIVWLIDAAGRYKPELGAFPAYALWRMRHGLSEYVKRKSSVVYVPGNVLRDQGKLRRKLELLQRKLKREPTVIEVARALRWTQRRAENGLLVCGGLAVAPETALDSSVDSWLTTWMSDRSDGDLIRPDADSLGRHEIPR